MKKVRIIKDWNEPDLMRQTPGGTGIWNDIAFTVGAAEACDYLMILNRVPASTTVSCPSENIWTIVQEPPVPEFTWLQQGFSSSHLVLTPNLAYVDGRVIHTHGALPWHVGRTYDALKSCRPEEKTRELSWITSNKRLRRGHRARLRFLRRIRSRVSFDLMGRGFAPLNDKWDGLGPYKYSLAIENHSAPHYWTEKLSDCFLARTMPIYYGCTNLSEYFPPESFVEIDIDDPDTPALIQDVAASNLWHRSRDAVEHARNLVLDTYQFFPFVATTIAAVESAGASGVARKHHLDALPSSYPKPLRVRAWASIRRRLRHLRYDT